MKVYIIRHGQTGHNKDRKFQGKMNISLNENGINEAKEKARAFPQDFDMCISSTLDRAVQTAKILTPYLDIITDERIAERGLGEFEGTVVTKEKLKKLDEKVPPIGAESMEEIDGRVKEFLDEIREKYNEEKILLVTHAGTFLSIARVLKLKNPAINNLEMIEIEI